MTYKQCNRLTHQFPFVHRVKAQSDAVPNKTRLRSRHERTQQLPAYLRGIVTHSLLRTRRRTSASGPAPGLWIGPEPVPPPTDTRTGLHPDHASLQPPARSRRLVRRQPPTRTRPEARPELRCEPGAPAHRDVPRLLRNLARVKRTVAERSHATVLLMPSLPS